MREEILDKYDALIKSEVRRYFSRAREEAARYHPFMGRVYENLAEYVLRKGRRQRCAPGEEAPAHALALKLAANDEREERRLRGLKNSCEVAAPSMKQSASRGSMPKGRRRK